MADTDSYMVVNSEYSTRDLLVTNSKRGRTNQLIPGEYVQLNDKTEIVVSFQDRDADSRTEIENFPLPGFGPGEELPPSE